MWFTFARVVKSTVPHLFLYSHYFLLCLFLSPSPVAMSLTMITTEKTSMTGKREHEGLLALLFSTMNRKLIMLTSRRPQAEHELHMPLWRSNWANMFLRHWIVVMECEHGNKEEMFWADLFIDQKHPKYDGRVWFTVSVANEAHALRLRCCVGKEEPSNKRHQLKTKLKLT